MEQANSSGKDSLARRTDRETKRKVKHGKHVDRLKRDEQCNINRNLLYGKVCCEREKKRYISRRVCKSEQVYEKRSHIKGISGVEHRQYNVRTSLAVCRTARLSLGLLRTRTSNPLTT